MKRIVIPLLLFTLTHASLAQLSGPLSGTLGPGTFHVIDTISVESTDTLRLMPGTTFTFDGGYPFLIYGTLLAEGTESDSIIFTTDTLTNPDRWRGLRFSNAISSASRLTYCHIDKSLAADHWPDNSGGAIGCIDNSSPFFTNCTIIGNSANGGGGGVFCYNNSSATFTNCEISENSAQWGGGGMSFDDCSPTLTDCIIIGNFTHWGGGGVCFTYGSSPSLTNCTISGNSVPDYDERGGGICCYSNCSPVLMNCTVNNNTAALGGGVYCSHSLPAFTHCTISNNGHWMDSEHGGGVYCEASSATFTNCTIFGNTVDEDGGGVHCDSSSPTFTNCTICANRAGHGGGVHCDSSSPTFTNSTIHGNTARHEGGGVRCDYSSPIFTNCTIRHNTVYDGGGGVYCNSSSPNFTHCTIAVNSAGGGGSGMYCQASSPTLNSSIVAFYEGTGVYFNASPNSRLIYSDVYGSNDGCFAFWNDDSAQGPPNIGTISTTNANGDPCDEYSNIFLYPMFVDTAVADFHLRAGSPCIDAGDPTMPLDPDSTVADIGAFYFDQSAVEPLAVLLPKACELHPNWPNPFNSSTMIRYDVPQASKVSLTIFNLLGQRVTTLFDGRQLAGSYTVAWDAANLPSGVYLCRMNAGSFAKTRKMVLVK